MNPRAGPAVLALLAAVVVLLAAFGAELSHLLYLGLGLLIAGAWLLGRR